MEVVNQINNVASVANIISNPQYEVAKLIGKKIVFPLLINNLTNMATTLTVIKESPDKNSEILAKYLKKLDLQSKANTITAFIKNIPENYYNNPCIHAHLLEINESLQNINEILPKISTENEHLNSWSYYIFGSLYYKKKINIDDIIDLGELLEKRYERFLRDYMAIRQKK